MIEKLKARFNCEAQQSITRFFILLSCAFIFSCHSGGTVVGSNKTQNSIAPVYDVATPTIVSPASNPYYSSTFSVTVTGLCMTDYRVQIVDILGFVKQTQICQNYSYSLTLSEATDGLYNYFITQKSSDGVISLPVPFIWIRKSSISVPMISSPAILPYASSIDNLTISGSCESNATVQLAGDAAGQTPCTNSSFSLNITKIGNGNFTIIVKQTDYAGNSAQMQFQWNKLGLGVSPSAPTLQVGTTQLFTLVGGSGSYTAVLSNNQSGGSFDPVTRIYTAGPLANAVDTLTVFDSLGVSATVPISTFHGPADHLEYSATSGDGQDGFTGEMLPLAFSAKVVDRYGNGVSFYPTFFQVVQGNSTVSGTVLQTSDLNGDVIVNIIAGDISLSNRLLLTSFGATLPDVGNTGNTKLEFGFTTKYAGVGLKGSTFNLSSNPNAVATSDINGDGFIDAVVVNSAEPSVGLLWGRGNGLFDAMLKIKPVCANPNTVVLADVNEDSLKDILITCGSSTAAVQIFINQGSGSFSTATGLTLDTDFENIPYMAKVVDIDGDGILDILTTNAGSSRLSIRKGSGNAVFVAPVGIAVGDSPTDIGIGDFNKDGNKDILVLSAATNDLTLIMNLGNMTFDNSQSFDTGATPLVVSVQDFNKDGWDDFAVLNSGSLSVTIYLNDKLGGFYERASLVTGAGPTSMDVKDIDGDSNPDVVVSNGTDSTVNVYFGDGTGLFDSSTLPITVTLNPSAILLSDINGDSIKDILVAGNVNNQLEFIPSQLGRKFSYITPADTNPVDVAFADFNKSGSIDMAVLSKSGRTIKIYNGNGKGLFSVSGVALATGDDSESFIAVDLQKRGLSDFVVANPNRGSVRVFSAQSNGTYTTPVDVAVGLGPIALISGDYNRDSYADLAVVNGNNATMSVLINNGSGLFLAKQDYAVGSNASGIVSTDLNKDGILDIIVSSGGTNTAGVLIGNGDGTFQARVDYGVGNSPTNIVAADFNKDGFEDIAVLTPVDNAVAILLGNGDGSLRPVNAYSAGTGLRGLVVGDFNGDNKLDLAVVNSDTLQFTVLNGAGNGQFNTTTVFDSPAPPAGLKSVDINNDRALDLILIDSTNSNINLWPGH